jgi:glycosyltransferase involved in cell wall biosynthesis
LDTLNPWTWRRTARYVVRRTPDLLVIPYWMSFFAPAFGWIARRARRAGTRVLYVVHNALPHERRPGDRLLAQYALRTADACLVMSDAVRRDLEQLGVAAAVHRVEHPVYDHFGAPVPRAAARMQLDLPLEGPVLLFFGFIRRYKGLHVLLESLPHVVEALPGVRLVVAGEFYEDAAPYHARIQALGLTEHVRLHAAYVPNDDVAAFFGAADVVVQPYVSATQSGVAQIAFHFDTPMIVTDVGGLAEVVPHEHAGLVVPPGDPQALAVAIIHFFEEAVGGDAK